MILVTGGTGFIGRRLVPELARLGHPVRVLSRQEPPSASPNDSIAYVQGDLLDARALEQALDGVTSVIHLGAAVPRGRQQPRDLYRTNVEGTRMLAHASRRSSTVTTFIHCSSAGVYGEGSGARPHVEGDPLRARTEYQRSKLAAEGEVVAALDERVRWVILRPTDVHGPGRPATMDFLRLVRRRPAWLFAPAETIVHPTYVGDVVSAILLVLARRDLGCDVFNIGGDRPLPYADFVRLIGAMLGRRTVQIRLPSWTAAAARAVEALMVRGGVRPPAPVSRLSRGVVNRAVDTTKAREVLGFAPEPLEAWLEQTVAWGLRERLV